MEDTMQKFCSKCGAELINGACPKCSQAQGDPQQSTEQQNDSGEKFKRFFMNPKERFVCALGNGYIQNFLADGYVGKGFAVVSDKRVYFNGKSYEVHSRRLKAMNESRIVDLKDVTGTGVRTITYPLLWIMSIAAAVLAVVIATIVAVNIGKSDHMASEMIWGNLFIFFPISFVIVSILYLLYYIFRKKVLLIYAFALTAIVLAGLILLNNFIWDSSRGVFIDITIFIPAAALLVSYFKSIKTILTISYAGGCIAFDINWYPKEESDEFQRMLRIAKDKAVEDSENATANAMREVVSTVVGQSSVQNQQSQVAVSTADELMKYAQLYKDGLLSEEEFAAIKAKML